MFTLRGYLTQTCGVFHRAFEMAKTNLATMSVETPDVGYLRVLVFDVQAKHASSSRSAFLLG
jgi:hypothetical protein